jgi:hypothetical protein
VRRGHDNRFLSAVIKDQLVGELAILQLPLVTSVGVDIGYLPDLDLLLCILLRHGFPPQLQLAKRTRIRITRPGSPQTGLKKALGVCT